MKRLLFIAYEFPPINSGGSHRPAKFVRALLDQGYHVDVVTCASDSFEDQKKIDKSLSFEHAHLTVHEVAPRPYSKKDRFFESYYFNIADRTWARWKAEVTKKLGELRDDYSAIYVTVPPFSMTYLVAHLKQRFSAPVFLDFRDAWSLWNIFPYVSKLHYSLTKKKEKQALELADRLLITSEQTAKDFCQLHGDHLSQKMTVITNSYEGEARPFGPLSVKDKYTITYVGSFYYNPEGRALGLKPWFKKKPHQWLQYLPRFEDWLYRSPYFFFHALSVMKKDFPDAFSKIQLNIAGHQPPWLKGMIEEFQLEEVITLLGPLPHDKAIALQATSDLLLLTSAKIPGGKDYSIAGKTFEYLKIGKPILAFVCEGAQKALLARTGRALILDPDGPELAAKLMADLINNQIVIPSHDAEVGKLSSTACANQLIVEIESLSS